MTREDVTTNPSCLQVGATCRYADGVGIIHDAVITDIISTLPAVVALTYDGGRRAQNVPYRRQPPAGHWGCPGERAGRAWEAGQIDLA